MLRLDGAIGQIDCRWNALRQPVVVAGILKTIQCRLSSAFFCAATSVSCMIITKVTITGGNIGPCEHRRTRMRIRPRVFIRYDSAILERRGR